EQVNGKTIEGLRPTIFADVLREGDSVVQIDGTKLAFDGFINKLQEKSLSILVLHKGDSLAPQWRRLFRADTPVVVLRPRKCDARMRKTLLKGVPPDLGVLEGDRLVRWLPISDPELRIVLRYYPLKQGELAFKSAEGKDIAFADIAANINRRPASFAFPLVE